MVERTCNEPICVPHCECGEHAQHSHAPFTSAAPARTSAAATVQRAIFRPRKGGARSLPENGATSRAHQKPAGAAYHRGPSTIRRCVGTPGGEGQDQTLRPSHIECAATG